MSAIVDRVGKVLVRVGGNSQEQATVIPEGLSGSSSVEKPQVGSSRVRLIFITDVPLLTYTSPQTFTPLLLISPNLIYAMGNVSNLIPGVQWFMGKSDYEQRHFHNKN